MKNTIFTLLFVVVAVSLFIGARAFAQDSRTVDETYPLAKDGELFIDTYKGSITVDTWDKAEVKIHVLIEPDGSGRDEREKVRDTEIRISDAPDRLRITSDYDKVRSNHSFLGIVDYSGSLPFVHYTITMPAGARLKIKDYKSDSRISNLRSEIDLETYKGTVRVRGFEGAIDLETYKGEVDIAFAKLADRSRVETMKGKVVIGIPTGAGFDLDTDFGRRVEFDSDFSISSHSRYRESNDVNGAVNGGGPTLRLISEKGDFRLMKL